MAEGVNVRFSGELDRFVKSRVSERGLYSSASEYIRDLVRRDYEQEEKKWAMLEAELRAGVEADRSEFVPFDIEKIIANAKKRKKANGR